VTPTGAVIMGIFAIIWWIAGLRSAGYGPAVVWATPVLASLALGAAATRLRGATGTLDAVEEARRNRLVMIWSAAEGVAIFIAINVLVNVGHRDAFVPVVALIVGAHFVPLARGLPAPTYFVTAAALIAVGLVGLAMPTLRERLTIVSAAAAVILWITAGVVLRRVSRSVKRVEIP
jgi:hypothetical protein